MIVDQIMYSSFGNLHFKAIYESAYFGLTEALLKPFCKKFEY